jgi:acetyl-CoA C-acetyltransferase
VAPEIAAKLKRPKVKLIGAGEFVKTQMGGKVDLTYSGARFSGATAFAEAGVKPSDIKFAAIYDSFTITVLMQLEDLGLLREGQGRRLRGRRQPDRGHRQAAVQHRLAAGCAATIPATAAVSPRCSRPVRQLRGEAHPKVQVKNCDLAIAHGTGGSLGLRHGSATVILERE